MIAPGQKNQPKLTSSGTGSSPYCAPAILWEQAFVALATCSFNPCLCNPPPPECSGG
jgi:hypothetical protein